MEAFLKEWGRDYLVRQRNILLMEGDGGPLAVVTACKGKILQDGIDFYKSPAYQELVNLRSLIPIGISALCRASSNPCSTQNSAMIGLKNPMNPAVARAAARV